MSSFNNVPPQLWMLLDKKVRTFLIEKFSIKMTGPAEIRDQEVISDGYNVGDLKVITKEMLEEYVGSTESFARAWELTCTKASNEVYPELVETPAEVIADKLEIINKKNENKKNQ